MDPVLTEAFGLDPDVIHLNHGAFGVAPVAVRRAAAAWRERAERNPHRFNRVEVAGLTAAARERAAAFLGVDPARAAWVRNVSEGVSAVLGSLPLRPGDELLTSAHGYGAVRKALGRHAARAGARVTEASFPVGAGDDAVVSAYAAACSPRTRLVVVDRVTSPTAAVLPVAAVAAAVAWTGATVLADAAHAPGQLDDDIAALGADHWVGNLHKWAYTPRGSAILWSRPGADVTPGVLSWQLDDGYAASFDYPGTWDYAGWLAAPNGLAYWAALGGWDAAGRLAALAAEGQQRVAAALGTTLEDLPVVPAPAMRLVPLPAGTLTAQDQADALYEALSERRVEVAPVFFGGAGYLRIAAGPYNTLDDYDRLAGAILGLLGRSLRFRGGRRRARGGAGSGGAGGDPAFPAAPEGPGASGRSQQRGQPAEGGLALRGLEAAHRRQPAPGARPQPVYGGPQERAVPLAPADARLGARTRLPRGEGDDGTVREAPPFGWPSLHASVRDDLSLSPGRPAAQASRQGARKEGRHMARRTARPAGRDRSGPRRGAPVAQSPAPVRQGRSAT